jgi:hypothetical protein
MKTALLPAVAAATVALVPAGAQAGEVFAGLYAHAVDTPLSLGTGESGADIELGFRGAPIRLLKSGEGPAPYGFVSVNTAGDTDFVAAGLAWKVDLGPVFVRPGVGLSYNNGPAHRIDPLTGEHTELGSRVLFEPELGLGIAIGPRTSLEASWVHISGARLFNREQNPGIDMIGVRLNRRF